MATDEATVVDAAQALLERRRELNAGEEEQPAPVVAKVETPDDADERKATVERVFKYTTIFELSTSVLGTSRKVSSDTFKDDYDTAKDAGLLRASKIIMECEELKAIKGTVTNMRQYLRKIQIPSKLKGGCYRINLDKVEEAEKKFSEEKAEFEAGVQALYDNYPQRLKEAKEKLGEDLWNDEDYPSREALKSFFSFYHTYGSFDPKIREASPQVANTLLEQESEKIEGEFDLIRRVLRVSWASIIEHAVTQLQPSEPGARKKVFKDALVVKMREFIDAFPSRNITNDSELADLVSKAKAILEGIDPKDIRKKEDVRTQVQTSFEQIKVAMAGLVQDTDEREITLTDELV